MFNEHSVFRNSNVPMLNGLWSFFQTNLVSDPNNAYCYHDEAGGDSELYELICDGEKHFRYYNNFNYDDYILHAYACVDYY